MDEQHLDVEVEFDAADQMDETEAKELIRELAGAGATASVRDWYRGDGIVHVLPFVAVVTVLLATAAGLAVIVAFIYRVFQCGVIIDLRGRATKVKKDKNMPRGSVLLLYADGRQEYREGIKDADIVHSLRDLLTKAKAGEG